LELTIDTRDEPLNPQNGNFFRTSTNVARKHNYVASSSDIPASLQEKRLEIDLESVVEILPNTVADAKISARNIQSAQKPLPISELYYLGGASSLRGYREEQFAGNLVAWSNLELRWIIGEYSRLFIFNDWGYVENSSAENTGGTALKRWHAGYGAGVNIETAAGILGIDYGLAPGNPIMQGKIHLKIRNEF